jgi:antimicrobial peptide system SdpB family protein
MSGAIRMNPLSDLRRGYGSLADNLEDFDARRLRVQLGRTAIAFAQLLTLTLTSWANLTADVLGRVPSSYCDGPRWISLFCIGSDAPDELGRWLAVVVCVAVIAGVLPRWVSLLHAWVAVSMAVSLSLPDGGEAVAVFSCALLIGVVAPDGRAFAWRPAASRARPTLVAVSYAASLALCLQMAGIYFESGLAKLAVSDWANGSAVYYIARDPMFGGTGALGGLLQLATAHPAGTALFTWGTIALECLVAVSLLLPSRCKRYGLAGIIVMHAGIAVVMGLWSFSLIMIGTATVAAYALPSRAELGANPGAKQSIRSAA